MLVMSTIVWCVQTLKCIIIAPLRRCFYIKPHVAHFQPWGCVAYSKIHVKRKDHSARGELCLFMGYCDRYHGGYRLYKILKKDFIITNDATFVFSSALNSSDINKPLSVQAINKKYDELMRTDGASVTSGLMMYNLKVGPNAACKEMYQDVMRYTDDLSLIHI